MHSNDHHTGDKLISIEEKGSCSTACNHVIGATGIEQKAGNEPVGSPDSEQIKINPFMNVQTTPEPLLVPTKVIISTSPPSQVCLLMQ